MEFIVGMITGAGIAIGVGIAIFYGWELKK